MAHGAGQPQRSEVDLRVENGARRLSADLEQRYGQPLGPAERRVLEELYRYAVDVLRLDRQRRHVW